RSVASRSTSSNRTPSFRRQPCVGAIFFVPLRCASPCKVNLLLNILARRPDGFHELETVMMPVPFTDYLDFSRQPAGIQLTCSNAELPVDGRNLVHRAAEAFLR